MARIARSKVFWSGGSQALRIPKEMRLSSREVSIRRRGEALIVEPVQERNDWDGFWDGLVSFARPVRRHPTRSAETRKPV